MFRRATFGTTLISGNVYKLANENIKHGIDIVSQGPSEYMIRGENINTSCRMEPYSPHCSFYLMQSHNDI